MLPNGNEEYEDGEMRKMPEELKRLLGIKGRHDKIHQFLEQSMRDESEKVEREVLMKLWGDIGSLETYWISFLATKAFANIKEFIDKEVDNLPVNAHALVVKAIGTNLVNQSELMLRLVAEAERMQKEQTGD